MVSRELCFQHLLTKVSFFSAHKNSNVHEEGYGDLESSMLKKLEAPLVRVFLEKTFPVVLLVCSLPLHDPESNCCNDIFMFETNYYQRLAYSD
jgi:hypothetical protein